MRRTLLSLLLPAAAQASAVWPFQTFRTTSFEPPNLKITKNGTTSDGYLFFDQSWQGAHEFAPFIMSDENKLIWEGHNHSVTSGVRPQMLDGEPVLTYWNGSGLSDPWGWGYGTVVVMDQSYEKIHTVHLNDSSFNSIRNNTNRYGWIDLHEDKITDRGTMLVTAVNVTRFDLTPVGGPRNGWVADSLFYEIDVKTNKVLFRWSALDHVDQIPLKDSLLPLDTWGNNQTYPWGYFHINSIDPLENGAYLVSSRFYCSVWQINKDGSVEWTLDGQNGGNFTLKDVNFCYQHDARLHGYTDNGLKISLFDNANSILENGTTPTSGLFIDLDLEKQEASLSRKLQDSNDQIYTVSQGNTQLISDDHVIMGYGSYPKIKEFDSEGTCVMTVQFGEDSVVSSYRAYRNKWVGKPKAKPAVFACNDDEKTKVYMSWNGATEHQTWKVYSGASRGNLTLAGTTEKSGFETVATVDKAGFVQVEASGEGIEAKRSLVSAVKSAC